MYNRVIMNLEPRIQILPESVASAIAAGEVVERPASVIKELVENALDAGATRIDIEIEEAGMAQMVVQDNGGGIRAEDVVLAVARYATSKLRTPEDLFNIKTLGFRGEALSSIAAVSRLELSTRALDEQKGTQLLVEAGEIQEKHVIGAPPGTRVSVRDLFFNVPARRKFVKSDRTERQRIQQLVSRCALAYPTVAFQLIQEGRVVFTSSGSGDEREVLAKVFDLELAQGMIALQPADELEIRIRGFISPLQIHRSNRQGLTFFVNGRWVQDASLGAAVVQAYHSLLMVGRYPVAVLFIDLPPDQVDVNVHPAKSEIRFREPGQVFSLVQRAVRAALLGHASPPEINLQDRWQTVPADAIKSWNMASPENLQQQVFSSEYYGESSEEQVPLLRSVGQVGRAYLVAEGPDGIYLIDQHAAHERILFEQYMHELDTNVLESQALLEALVVEFSPEQTALLKENLPELGILGFEVEEFGGQSFRLRAVPSLLTGKDPIDAIRAVVEEFEEDETPLASKREALLAARICKRLAIKAGQLLSLEEQRALIRALEGCGSPRTCPHGRPTMIHLPVAALARQFGRT